MNSTIYLFGNFGQGITLYPDDYTKDIFTEFISRASAPTQVIIHRDGDIMNYGYIRKIENDHILGICFQINGQYFTVLKPLFEIFEDFISNLVVRGEIIKLDNKGDLIKNISNFTDKPTEVESIINCFRNFLANLSSDCLTLPYVDLSTSNSDIRYYKDTDNELEVIPSTVRNGYTYIYKANDYDTLALGGYRSTLYYLNRENEKQKDEISQLSKELNIVKRQKKQIKYVVYLMLLFFFFALLMWNVISDKNENIELQVGKINNLTMENNKYHDSIVKLNSNLIQLTDTLFNLSNNYQEFKQIVSTSYPIIIDSIQIADTNYGGSIRTDFGEIIYASNSMYIRPKVKYIGLVSELIELKVKFFTPTGELSVANSAPDGYSYSNELQIDVGENEFYLSGYGNSIAGSWGRGLYKIEVWYKDICLKAVSFRLY